MAMAPSNFPLRWEIIGDQWWFASPIDWAAANGHYDLVRELLHLDTNLLIKLTSLRRIRRLETVWDDDEEHQFNDVPKQRSLIAQKLLLECESKKGHNSLIRAGYGGWLLYTASSAGDVAFVKELLERNPLLVYGEGEYGVTDILYAGSRSKSSEVFKVLLDYCLRNCMQVSSVYRGEILNRAVHAAARGGNVEVLKELLGDGKDVSSYRDSQGSTLLHTASGRGQVEVVKTLLESYDLINSTDNQGNTALHIAAYRGNLKVVELLVSSSPSITSMKNSYGDTFLHMAVASFRSPGFRRLDRQMALMRRILSNKDANIEDLINVTNNDGRTALHMAVSENIHSDLVELLMSVPMINLNIRDDDGRTPLDLLKQRPKSASSEILIRRLISAGGTGIGISRNALVSHLKMQGIGGSPGTSFRIPDSEIFLYTGLENEYISGNLIESPNLEMQSGSYKSKISSRLKIMLHLPKKKEIKKMEEEHQNADSEIEDSLSLDSYRNEASPIVRHNPVSLRQRFSKMNSKVVSMPSPSSKKKFAAGLMQGVLQVKRHSSFAASSSPLSRSTWSSPVSTDGERDGRSPGMKTRMKLGQNSFKGVNKYLCFGAQGLNVEDGIRSEQSQLDNRHL